MASVVERILPNNQENWILALTLYGSKLNTLTLSLNFSFVNNAC